MLELRKGRLAARSLLTVVLGACTLLVLASAAWKGVCLDGSRNFRLTCYSDVLELWSSRDLVSHDFPYVGGRLVDGNPVGAFEYPVLTGVFLWFSALFADSRLSYLVVSTLLLGPFAVLVAWRLFQLTGRRALLWAAAPALILYALHNWDLLAVAAAVGGIVAWHRGRSLRAAVLFGVGTCLKLYPGLFVLPLAADRLARGDRAGALRVLGVGAATVLAINLPFVLADRQGWATTYVFQSARSADLTSNSLWFWIAPIFTTDQLNLITPALVLAGLLVAVAYGLVQARKGGEFPFLAVCGAALVGFLLWNKASSPQYTLWVLPFFALLRVRLGWWVAYAVSDALVYVGVFRWFHDLNTGTDFGLAKQLLIVGVWTKTALLGLLFVVFLRATDALLVRPVQPTHRPAVKASVVAASSGSAIDR